MPNRFAVDCFINEILKASYYYFRLVYSTCALDSMLIYLKCIYHCTYKILLIFIRQNFRFSIHFIFRIQYHLLLLNFLFFLLFQDKIAIIPLVIYVSGFLSSFFVKFLNHYLGNKVNIFLLFFLLRSLSVTLNCFLLCIVFVFFNYQNVSD